MKRILLTMLGIALLSFGFSLRDLPEETEKPAEAPITCNHLFYIIDEETGQVVEIFNCSGQYIKCDGDRLICKTYLL